MTTDVGHVLLTIAGFLTALGALIAIMDRIESSLYDAMATPPDGQDISAAAMSYDDSAAPPRLPEPRRQSAASNVLPPPADPAHHILPASRRTRRIAEPVDIGS